LDIRNKVCIFKYKKEDMKTENEIREKYEKMLKHTEDLDDMVQNPSKYSGINIENIQDHIRIREEQYKMNALIEWILK
jgi:hypothetical protein